MKMRCFALLVIVALCVSFAGCAQQSNSLGSVGGSDLLTALAYAPAQTKLLAFTNWSLIKASAGFSNITSKSSDSDRKKFFAAVNLQQAEASAFGLNYILTGAAQTWSFDSFDYAWEATIETDSAYVYIVKLRADFDVSPVVAHFKDRGFSASVYRSATIYSHDGGLATLESDWFGPYGFDILNTAVLTNEKILVFSAGLTGVHAALDAQADSKSNLASDSALRDVAQAMGTVFSAEFETSTAICSRLGSLPTQMQANLRSDLAGISNLHGYSWFGVGYRYEQQRLLGVLALHFSNASDASADLESRRKIATSGISIASSNPYSEDIFTVESAATQSANLLLQVSPVEKQPSRLFTMFDYTDFAFAACPA